VAVQVVTVGPEDGAVIINDASKHEVKGEGLVSGATAFLCSAFRRDDGSACEPARMLGPVNFRMCRPGAPPAGRAAGA
jgi:hypothetical protein